jgi:hypothetical protein
MQDTVLIILASVVALIVIVVLLGLRYLRADDDEDFDDVADGGRSRTAGLGRERGRARGYQDVTPAGRAGPDAMRGGGEPGGGRSRPGGREGDPVRGRPDNGQAPLRRSARHVPDGSGELVGAAARSGDSRDGRAERARRDHGGRNDPTAAGWPREVSERRTTPPGGRPPEAWDARDDRAGYRDGPEERGAARRGGGSDDRRSAAASAPRREESLPDVQPRRGKREGEDNWPSTEWDELSDVDYWAELASDKPLTGPSQTAPALSRGARAAAGSRRDTNPGSRGRREDGPSRGPDREASKLPTRVTRRPEPAVRAAAVSERPDRTDRVQRAGRQPDEFGPTVSRRPMAIGPESALAALADSGLHPPVPRPVDDDPLTSPSFPRIASDDSRSYRRNRTAPQPIQAPPGQQQYPGYTSGQFSARPALPGAGHPGQAVAADPYQVAAQSQAMPGGYPPAAGSVGYQGLDNGYQASTAAFPTQHAGAMGYPADPGPAGYLPQSAPVPYSSPPSYAPPPGGYPADPGSGGYPVAPAAAYPSEPPGRYQGYPQSGVTSSSGPHMRPPDNGYLPAGPPTAAYPVPGAPTPLAPQAPMGHLPAGGYPAAPMYTAPAQTVQYQAAPYEPPAYQPVNGHETAGYVTGDPYSVDPYGYNGRPAY